MKKIIGFLILVVSLFGCSDGDIEIQNIDFETVPAYNCNDIVYKIKGNEVFFIVIPATDLAYKNEVKTKTIPIGGAVKVVYRNYSGVPSGNNFCNPLPAASPNVVEEWTAVGGAIEIKTTAIKTDPDLTNQATRITKYNHYIVFKNIKFQKPNGEQLYDDFKFGNYQTNTNLQFPLSGVQSFTACSLTAQPQTRIYANSNTESVLIDNLDPALFVNMPNTTAIIKNLGSTTNALTIKTYNGTLLNTFYCGLTLPTNPVVQDTWKATSGTIEVTTTASSNTYTHSIRLKNVTIEKTGLYPESFYLGNDYNLGTFVR